MNKEVLRMILTRSPLTYNYRVLAVHFTKVAIRKLHNLIGSCIFIAVAVPCLIAIGIVFNFILSEQSRRFFERIGDEIEKL